MNPCLQYLHPYPFERLRGLLSASTPNPDLAPIRLSIGEPKHPTPACILDALKETLETGVATYPASAGSEALRTTIANWLMRRYRLGNNSIDSDQQVLPVAGTREGLFAVTPALVDTANKPLIMMPNPFYQIYEGAALLAGGQPLLLNTTADNAYQPVLERITAEQWARCGIIYLCSPGNPNGKTLSQAFWESLLAKQQQYGFVVVADECYSELYRDESTPPLGLLEACNAMGNSDYTGCLVFHSLSKRSNAPGLRSGFVAGDQKLISAFRQYRTYHGCALPNHVQAASIAAWSDEAHVIQNRQAYREKFSRASDVLQSALPYTEPEAGFYLWLPVPGGDDENFTRQLYETMAVTVLPGRYLSRPTPEGDPGASYVRVALVAEPEICEDALARINAFASSYQ
ncbi:MAG: succinyldiaminopimelate transaminase [Gammaproteobacteria bacterium]|nr:succinyldiaminopimelate transaminase [Gammaproteobacteria bacterium]